jgi:hypothetical protein
MDNKINDLRRKIKALREAMLITQRAMQAEIACDRDCSHAALELLGLRTRMARLVDERRTFGDLTPI